MGTVPGVTTLDESYARCRQLTKAHGTTYYAATFLLPRVKQHHVHALYGFCRHARDVVKELGPVPTDAQYKGLTDFGDRFFADLDRGDSDDAILKAVVHTVVAFDINPDCFRRYLRSMETNLTVMEYETFDDLLDYMDGSAAVVGEMLLPILEPTSAEAVTPARDLAIAFQLTTLLQDVGKHLDAGRVYLPQEDLRRFGADPALRQATPEWRALMSFEIRRTREYYASADAGVALLPSSSARCIGAARRLFGEVLDRIEQVGGDVFSSRPRVPVTRTALAVGRSMLARRRGV